MDATICHQCQRSYNKSNRIPRILILCGHTICAECITLLLTSSPDQSFQCPIDQKVKLIRNMKILQQ
jgi:hypothetical protein